MTKQWEIVAEDWNDLGNEYAFGTFDDEATARAYAERETDASKKAEGEFWACWGTSYSAREKK